ncbi:hypothetical protein BurJ1DRAFT_0447 [Burkholderiales bacterium JOSHI_001]|nr:hypothetical protein BurJ1DRAFT_0447 [Burkholderiales bacterium JOSHI_001]
MKRRRDLLARLEASYATPLRRHGVAYQLPAITGNTDHARPKALDKVTEAPRAGISAPQPDEVGALDTWYRVEDLWLRLGALLPLALVADREQRFLHWLGLRQLVEPGTGRLLRSAAQQYTYEWREAGQRRSLVRLLAWEQDDLMLDLMPTRQLQRWAEGDALAALMHGHLARHATPLPRTEAKATAWRSAPVPTG